MYIFISILLHYLLFYVKNTQSPDEYQFNIKIDKLKAPIKPGEVVGNFLMYHYP